VNWVFEPKKILLTINEDESSVKINENTNFIRQITMCDLEEIILRLECCACFMH
jgi:hypothetical protein